MTEYEIIVTTAEQALKKLLGRNVRVNVEVSDKEPATYHWNLRMIKMDKLMMLTCREFNVQPDDVKGPCRRSEYLEPRFVFCYLATIMLGIHRNEIARYVGKDRTTVLHGVKRVRYLIEIKDRITTNIESIKEKFLNT